MLEKQRKARVHLNEANHHLLQKLNQSKRTPKETPLATLRMQRSFRLILKRHRRAKNLLKCLQNLNLKRNFLKSRKAANQLKKSCLRRSLIIKTNRRQLCLPRRASHLLQKKTLRKNRPLAKLPSLLCKRRRTLPAVLRVELELMHPRKNQSLALDTVVAERSQRRKSDTLTRRSQKGKKRAGAPTSL